MGKASDDGYKWCMNLGDDGDISAALLPDPDEKYKSEAGSVSRLLSLLEEPARSRIKLPSGRNMKTAERQKQN